MKLYLPDYENCIADLPGSILEKFGMDGGGRRLELLDQYLEKDYENIVVILLDAMGSCILRRNLDADGFFNSHLRGHYSSVFPPTTVAATTTIMSGLTPCEHSWLGWDCYYPQIDKNVQVYSNQESGTEQPAADYPVAWTYCGYESVVSRIRKQGGSAYEVSPFMEPFPDSFDGICCQIRKLCSQPGKKYIYAYWNEPDSTMHRKGCYGTEAKRTVRLLEQQVQQMCGELKHTLVLVTADHGHMDAKGVAVVDYPKITECLVRMPSIEPRALNLFVKEGKGKQLEYEFQKSFGDKFLLLTKRQVLGQKLFGTGQEHPLFQKMLGDYLAVAVSDLAIYNTSSMAPI